MLVLERSRGEGILIGENVRVRVLSSGEKRVTLGIEAPREVTILREELAQRDAAAHANAASATAAAAGASQATGTTTPDPFRLLLVEDNPIHAKLIRRALSEKSGIAVDHALSGEEAVRLLPIRNRRDHARVPDLILLDLGLPGMSGVDVLEAIRAVPTLRHLPVVVLSCSSYDADISLCLSRGANAFVSKNHDYAELRESINRITGFWMHTRHVA